MKRLLTALLALFLAVNLAYGQTVSQWPNAITTSGTYDFGNGPFKLRIISGIAYIFTSSGSGTGSTSGSSTTLTLTGTPATAPCVGCLISGSGITSGTTVAAYNGTTTITLSAAMTVPGGTALTWGAACPALAPSNPMQMSAGTDYYYLYTQARICGVSPGGPSEFALTTPPDSTSSGGGGSGVSSVTASNSTLTISPNMGAVLAGLNLANANAWTAQQTIAANNVAALAVGLNGGTNPAFAVDTTTASSVTGVKVKSAAAGGGVAVSVQGGNTNEQLNIDAKGTGVINLGGTSTGNIVFNRAMTYGGVGVANAVTGTGNMVLSNSPALTTPNLGTPSAATLTNATGLPISTGVSGLGTNVATFLATPSSANLAAAMTDETGTGANVFANSPSLTTPSIAGATVSGTANFTGTFQFGGNTMTFPGSAANLAALNLTGQNLSGGATVTPNNLTAGTSFTVNCGTSPLQWIVNTGAFTITPPTAATSQSCAVRVINGTTAANAGAVTLAAGWSGKTPGGASFSTTPTTSAATVSFTNGSATIGWTTSTPPVNSIVFFTTSGALPTNFSTATLYYVVSSSAGVSVTVSATPGGSAITAGSAGSGTQNGYVPSVYDLNVQNINSPPFGMWTQIQ